MTRLTRREFLRLTGATGLAVAGASFTEAVEPIQRTGPPRLRLSLAAYSFRQYFKQSNKPAQVTADVDAARQMDLFQFVDYCAAQGCEGTELTSYYFPKDLTDDYLTRLRARVAERGLTCSGTAVGNNFTVPPGPARDKQIADVKAWIDRAAVLGAPHIRVFAGATRDAPVAEQQKLCISALEECCDYAGRHKIMLGVENHGGIVAEPEGLLAIVKAVRSPWCGINLDTGNFHTADPYAGLAQCAPYAVNVQVKTDIRRKDAKDNEPVDLARIVKMLRDVNYQGFAALEYEAKEDPYTAVPRWLKQMKEAFAA